MVAMASPSGSMRVRLARTGTVPDAELKNSSIGTSTKTGPRWLERARVKASSTPAATSPRS